MATASDRHAGNRPPDDAARSAFLGWSIVAGLWALALYLAAYYAAVWTWDGNELCALLGQDLYNALIPLGGRWAIAVPATVFALVLGVVRLAWRPIDGVASRLAGPSRAAQRAWRVAILAATLLVAVPGLHAVVTEVERQVLVALQRARRHEVERIQVEPRAQDPLWTGADMAQPVEAFCATWGLGSHRLILAADGSFRSTLLGCEGALIRRGRCSRRHGGLGLEAIDAPPGEDLATDWREVPWGERLYLVANADAELLRFCNAVNAGEEPVAGGPSRFLLRDGDELRPVSSLPVLPDAWQARLLREPLAGRTTQALPDGTAWVDMGSEQGLALDLELWLPAMPVPADQRHRRGGRSATVEPVRVVEVEPRRSRVAAFVHPGWAVPAGLEVVSRRPAMR